MWIIETRPCAALCCGQGLSHTAFGYARSTLIALIYTCYYIGYCLLSVFFLPVAATSMKSSYVFIVKGSLDFCYLGSQWTHIHYIQRQPVMASLCGKPGVGTLPHLTPHMTVTSRGLYDTQDCAINITPDVYVQTGERAYLIFGRRYVSGYG